MPISTPSAFTHVAYHKACADGTAAAYLASICPLFSSAQFIPISHAEKSEKMLNDLVESMKDGVVLFVDLAPPESIIDKLLTAVTSLIILDHHKTSEYLLQDRYQNHPKLNITLDKERSGVRLMFDWIYSFSDGERSGRKYAPPWWVEHIEDKDLWTWKIAGSKSTNAYMSALDIFETPEKFGEMITTHSREFFEVKGDAMLATINMQVEKSSKKAIDAVLPFGEMKVKVKVVETSFDMINDIGDYLCKKSVNPPDIALMYSYNPETQKFACSLRSAGFNTEMISKAYGGGGHLCSSGFGTTVLKIVDGVLILK